MEFYYGVETGGSVNHLEFYGVENFRCNPTNSLSNLPVAQGKPLVYSPDIFQFFHLDKLQSYW